MGISEEFYYKINACSLFEFYTRSVRYAIHEDITFLDLLKDLMKNVPHKIRGISSKKYSYLFQYRESDFKILQFLIASSNMYYCIDHEEEDVFITDNERLKTVKLYCNYFSKLSIRIKKNGIVVDNVSVGYNWNAIKSH